MLTQELLKSLLSYDPTTGIFRWLARADARPQWNGKHAGKIAGNVERRGYTVIRLRVDGKDVHFYAHRLAFIFMTGECPELVDHEDRNKQNNRWANLRSATSAQNVQNRIVRDDNTSGFKGVSWNANAKKWNAYMNVGARKKHLGYFNTAQEAHEVHRTAAADHYGQYACLD